MHDKELRACAVIVLSPCHGDYAALVGKSIVYAVCGKFALDSEAVALTVGIAARAVAERVAALNHEAVHYAVKCEPVIEALLCEIHKVFHGYGSDIGIKLYCYGAVVFDLYLCYGFLASAGAEHEKEHGEDECK